MSAIAGQLAGYTSLADGTLRIKLDIQREHASEAVASLFGDGVGQMAAIARLEMERGGVISNKASRSCGAREGLSSAPQRDDDKRARQGYEGSAGQEREVASDCHDAGRQEDHLSSPSSRRDMLFRQGLAEDGANCSASGREQCQQFTEEFGARDVPRQQHGHPPGGQERKSDPRTQQAEKPASERGAEAANSEYVRGDHASATIPGSNGDSPCASHGSGSEHSSLRTRPAQADESRRSAVAPAAGKRPWHELKSSQQAGIRCHDPAFRAWLGDLDGLPAPDEAGAAGQVRLRCDVDSRSELDTSPEAAARWSIIDTQYQAATGMLAEQRG